MRRALLLFVVALSSACQRPPSPPLPPTPGPTPAPHAEVTLPPPPTIDEQEAMAALSGEGAQAFAGLNTQSDAHHGATWFQGNVAAHGSTAYLYLGKLGESGAATLRFVVRYQGAHPANLASCTVSVDGVEVGAFSPAPNRADQPGDGSVVQLSDIHFDDVRPMVLAMINASSAVVRTADGKEIRLDRPELEEMRRVLAAYLHLQGTGSAP